MSYEAFDRAFCWTLLALLLLVPAWPMFLPPKPLKCHAFFWRPVLAVVGTVVAIDIFARAIARPIFLHLVYQPGTIYDGLCHFFKLSSAWVVATVVTGIYLVIVLTFIEPQRLDKLRSTLEEEGSAP